MSIFLSWEAFFAFHFYFQVFYGHSFVSISLSCLFVYFGLFISRSSCCFFQFVIYNSRFILFQSNHSLAHLFWIIRYVRISPFSSSLNVGSAFKLRHFIFVFVAAAALARHNHYVYGREVIVQTDHKPLENIFKKPLLSAPRGFKGRCYICRSTT